MEGFVCPFIFTPQYIPSCCRAVESRQVFWEKCPKPGWERTGWPLSLKYLQNLEVERVYLPPADGTDESKGRTVGSGIHKPITGVKTFLTLTKGKRVFAKTSEEGRHCMVQLTDEGGEICERARENPTLLLVDMLLGRACLPGEGLEKRRSRRQ